MPCLRVTDSPRGEVVDELTAYDAKVRKEKSAYAIQKCTRAVPPPSMPLELIRRPDR